MIEITEEDFKIFDRKEFTFKQINENYPKKEIEEIKNSYKTVWLKWKNLQNEVCMQLIDDEIFGKPKIESWTNGWNLRNHFWSAYRGVERQEENACAAVLMNRKQIQIYLMFQHYRSDRRKGTKEDYNHLLKAIPAWSQHIDTADYYIWRQQDPELENHLPLKNYLEDLAIQKQFQESLEGGTFQLGKIFYRGIELNNLEDEIAESLKELAPLYLLLDIRNR